MTILLIVGAGIAYLLFSAKSFLNSAVTPAPDTGSPAVTPSPAGEPIVTSYAADRNKLVWWFARGIAIAEGYMRSDGSILLGNKAARFNNPGNLFSVAGFYITYDNPGNGWQALFDKLETIFNGGSTVYPLTFTISQLCNKWVTGDENNEIFPGYNPSGYKGTLLSTLQDGGYTVGEGTFLNDLVSNNTDLTFFQSLFGASA